MKKRIAVFGGTFDPVHSGHMAVARYTAQQVNLDKIIFLPNGNPPHKDSGEYADGFHRYNMLVLATESYPSYEVSDYELDGKRHYTYETLEHFKKLYPQCNVMFIIGADSLDYLDKWHRGEELIRNNTFIVVNRNFRKGYDFEKNIKKIRDAGGDIIVVDMPFADISSTEIRADIKQGKKNNMIDLKVEKYIIENKIYCYAKE